MLVSWLTSFPACTKSRTKKSVETANRHLEDLDILLSGDSPFAWRAERQFQEIMMAQRQEVVVEDGDVLEK